MKAAFFLAAAPPAAAHPGALPAPVPTIPVPAVPAHALPGAIASPLPQAVPMMPTWFQLHASWFTHGIAGLFVLSAISIVILLAVQTTKQEGLSGTLGGRVESSYRGRLGADEQLKRITGWAAVGYVIAAFILSLTGI